MPGPNAPYTQLSANQCIQQAFDESQDKLRVDASVSVTQIVGEVSVEIDAADGDNIALASPDGSKKVTVTTVGSSNALDVNIVGDSSGLSTPIIQNVAITTPFVEQSLVFSASTKRITLKVRGDARLQISFVAGMSGTTYFTIPPGNSYTFDNLKLSSPLNLYFQASKAQVLEVLSWS